MSSQQSPSTPSGSSANYFVDQKKGEVNELKQLLKNLNIEKDVTKKRDVIKKVIAYMTLGIDVSRLFTDMIMAIETKDLVIKKMVYLYLSTYARQQPDMAIMCINTLRRDCDNEDPMVRGLALRSLTSLRMDSLLEYVTQPLKKALNDISAYVRKTAVLGILKIYHFAPAFIQEGDYLETLEKMIFDVDPAVITNVVMALEEINITKGGMHLTSTIVMHLLNKLSEFSEWGLNCVLSVVVRYIPASEDEIFTIMNVLDPIMKTSNCGSVLATINYFLILLSSIPDLLPQVVVRAKAPLLTLLTTGQPEIQFTVLKHLQVLLPRSIAAGVFCDEYRQFFVRYNEPSYVKHLKVDILPYLANADNVKDIAAELSEYVTDVDSELSKRAITSIGEIAINLSIVSNDMTQRLVELIDLDMSFVRTEAIKVIGKVLRIYPDMRVHLLQSMSRYLKHCDDSTAKAVLVWILGEFGNEIIEAPYLLEHIIDDYQQVEDSKLKLQILASSVSLFFKRPPEMQAMLGRLFTYSINDTTNQDVHDRALLYYRLLSTNVEGAHQVLTAKPDIKTGEYKTKFVEEMDFELINQVFSEFNTLAVIYGKPAVQFINEPFLLKNVRVLHDSASADGLEIKSQQFSVEYFNGVVDHVQEDTNRHQSAPSFQGQSQPSKATEVNLLDWDDAPAQPSPQPSRSSTRLPTIALKSNFELTPQNFQQMWTSLPESKNGKLCTLLAKPAQKGDIEAALRQINVFTMASGPNNAPAGFKFFLYAQEVEDLMKSSTDLFLLQITYAEASGDVNVVIKSPGASANSIALFCNSLVTGFQQFVPN